MQSIGLLSGADKDGRPEGIDRLKIKAGQFLAVVGPTGSGKSELLSDIEQMADRDTVTGRRVLVDEQPPGPQLASIGLVAQLSQKNNLVMDGSVERFLSLHAECRSVGDADVARRTLDAANRLCGEAIRPGTALQVLSGGQSRALMIADIAFISDAPVVLIDEIENAGLDKFKALEVLAASNKPILIATHDPVLMLMTQRRLVMKNGAMDRLVETGQKEMECLERLRRVDGLLGLARQRLREGRSLTPEEMEL